MSASLSTELQVANAVSDYQRLINLDAVWTNHLARSTSISPQDIDSLGKVTNEMKRLLRIVPQHAETIATISAAIGERKLRPAFTELLDRMQVGAKQRKRVEAHFAKPQGLSQSARARSSHLSVAAGEEIASLNAKMRGLRSNGFAPGDLRRDTLCSIGASAAVAGAMTIGTGVGAFAFGFGVGILLFGDC